jgi:glycosyltransferase involved in cell wall biosynthesis
MGCDDAANFSVTMREFFFTGLDADEIVASHRRRFGGTWLPTDFGIGCLSLGDSAYMRDAIVVCDDVLGRGVAPEPMLESLRRAADLGATILLTAPEAAAPRTWSALEFAEALKRARIEATFVGRTSSDDRYFLKRTHLAIVDPPERRLTLTAPPDDFRVAALVTIYNERDVIGPTIEHLCSQGVDVHLMDNWSTDGSLERVAPYLGRGVSTIEKNPVRDTGTYDLERVLQRMEHLTYTLDYDWFIDYDADEIRRSPFDGVDLRTAIYAIDRLGDNAIDFTVMNFRPVDNRFLEGEQLEPQFNYFEFGRTPDHLRQRKGWKNTGQPVFLLERAGHDVLFRGRSVHPYKFLNKHYPIRSQAHGERKLLTERRARFNRREHELRKWHVHYDDVSVKPDFQFDPGKLERYDSDFYEKYLVERLTGIGASREDGYLSMYLNHHGESV